MQSLLVARSVAGIHPRGVDDLQRDQGAVGAEQAADGREVAGRLGGEEQVRAGDVAAGVDDEEEADDGRAFRVPRRVDAGECPAQDQGAAEHVLQPCARNEGVAVFDVDGQEADQTGDSGEGGDCWFLIRVSVLRFICIGGSTRSRHAYR